MIWFFERGRESVRVEVRFDRATSHYTVTLKWGDGRVETERYATLDDFRRRVAALQERLEGDRWRQSGSPSLIAEDWWGPSSGH